MRISAGGADNVRASVAGSRDYKVHVRMNREEVIVECDCRYFQSEDFCKHIWATLLAAESNGYLTRIASAWDPFVKGAFEEEEAYDFTDPQPETPRPTRPAKPAKDPPAPPWKEDVAALRRVAGMRITQNSEPQRRILYVVDVAECISAGNLVVQCVAAKLKRNGEWGRPNFQESSIRNVGELDRTDQEIVALLAGSA